MGIDTPVAMANKAVEFGKEGVKIIKVKLEKNGREDVERIRLKREAIGNDIQLRIDANQGWDLNTAVDTLKALGKYDIQYCEQPIPHQLDR